MSVKSTVGAFLLGVMGMATVAAFASGGGAEAAPRQECGSFVFQGRLSCTDTKGQTWSACRVGRGESGQPIETQQLPPGFTPVGFAVDAQMGSFIAACRPVGSSAAAPAPRPAAAPGAVQDPDLE